MMLIFLCFLGLFQNAKAADMSVIDVRRNITLAEDDTVYKDFYINAGPDSGLKKNLVVTAVRKINIRDAAGANSFGEILVPVGQLKVIAIYDKVAVAREFNLLSRDELPMLEQIGIMSGDRIDLRGSFIDNSKPKVKHKVSEAQPTSGTTVVTTTLTTTTTTTSTASGAAPLPNIAAAPAAAAVVAPVVAKASAPPATEKLLQGGAELKSPVATVGPAKQATEVAKASPPPAPTTPAAEVPETAEKLEKVADSGNNSEHE
ncbi:MAG TPA: hypothetical protein VF412_01470 [Bdellovibrio sp.]|uniref:hypothetical protein n=1 Tax=Bdellovibrio sp. TaxID=28201 RepID=UPI002F1EC1A9